MATKASTHKGGQELPDDVHNTSEQNRGYDEVVRGTERAKQQQDSEGLEQDAFDEDDCEDAESDEDEGQANSV